MKSALLALAAAGGILTGGAASASVVTLTFDQLNGSYFPSVGQYDQVLDFYNGGTDARGATGPNYGISFNSDAIVGCEQSAPCANTNTNLLPSSPNVLFFISGTAATMNVAAGFTTGFSFYYSAIRNPGVINVWSGLNDTGTLLATLTLPITPTAGAPGCMGVVFCPYSKIGVAFSGTAESVDFSGTVNAIGFDNITLGSVNPGGGAPEPATWAIMLLGFAGVGMSLRRRAKMLAA